MWLPHVHDLDLTAPLEHFAAHGYARLGPVLSPSGADDLAACAEALMTAEQPHPDLFFQHDAPTGRYEDLDFGAGWVGPSLRYRKLERLERVPAFRTWIENPLFARLAHTVLGDDVRLYRAVLWNKAVGGGMAVPWHQDDGKFWGLDTPPMLQVWTAIDDAPAEAGCLEVLPGSHRCGLASPEGGTVRDDDLAAADAEANAVALPARRGECILVHNHTWHRTGRNRTANPRRALSISFLSGDTGCTRRRRAPRQFERLWQAPAST